MNHGPLAVSDVHTKSTQPEKFDIGDDLEVLEAIAQGRISRVFKARQKSTQRLVAVKLLNLQPTKENLQSFSRVALSLQNSAHPDIIKPCIFGETESQKPYVVVELAQGQTLSKHLKSAGALPLQGFRDVFMQVVDALSFAHENGIVHGDIKPSLIFLQSDSNRISVKLAGFENTCFHKNPFHTRPRTYENTARMEYMSPELHEGEQPSPRSDIYSLGCVMYECLAGHPPFRGTPAEIMYQQMNAPAPTLTTDSFGQPVPTYLQAILSKCMERSPKKRYQNLQELKKDLISQRAKMPAPSFRQKYANLAMAVIAILLVAYTAFLFYDHQRTVKEKASARQRMVIEQLEKARSAVEVAAAGSDQEALRKEITYYSQATRLPEDQAALQVAFGLSPTSTGSLNLWKAAFDIACEQKNWIDAAERCRHIAKLQQDNKDEAGAEATLKAAFGKFPAEEEGAEARGEICDSLAQMYGGRKDVKTQRDYLHRAAAEYEKANPARQALELSKLAQTWVAEDEETAAAMFEESVSPAIIAGATKDKWCLAQAFRNYAEQLLAQRRRVDTKDAKIYLLKAIEHIERGKGSSSSSDTAGGESEEESAKYTQEENAERAVILYELGQLYEEGGNYPLAKRDFRLALDLKTRLQTQTNKEDPLIPFVQYHLANANLRTGYKGKAIEYLQQAIAGMEKIPGLCPERIEAKKLLSKLTGS